MTISPRALTALLMTLLAAGCGPLATADDGGFLEHIDPAFLENPYWFDGTAELNLYDASLVKYGQPREAESVAHIVVAESHKPDLLVKADDWREPGLVPMLKFNYVTSVRTGVYSYQQMLSFFFDRSSSHLTKMTLASHEWCGNTFKELVNFRGRESYSFNTYWDGQGAGSFEVDFPEGLVVYESVPVQLRALSWREGLEVTLHLLPPQLSSKAAEPRWQEARLVVGGREKIEVPAGAFDTWAARLEHPAGEDWLWFEADFPHRLVRWEAASGDRFALRTSQKIAYWQHSGPGDEALLE